jgi:valyl-tRNA synthetase
MKQLPSSYNHLEIEAKWSANWEKNGVYRSEIADSEAERFVVDTPPPTVSGSLHVGHVFSYTHTDLIARYNRMKGKKVYYPMGWDDNGLPTERRVQNKFGLRCNPKLPYDANWKPQEADKDRPIEEVSRRNFTEACSIVTAEDEAAFEALWRRNALSVDWSKTYATIDAHCRKISQLSFIDLVEKGHLYNADSPSIWDIDFQTALAQADLEDRPRNSFFHYVRFGIEGGGEFTVATTRPELIAATFAICVHPDDERFNSYIGKRAISPLFRIPLPIEASSHVDPTKGTGVMMVSTFGDNSDVDYWKRARVPARLIVGRDGKLLQLDLSKAPFASIDPEYGNANYQKLAQLPIEKARKKIVELLAEENSGPFPGTNGLTQESKPTEQVVKYYEKGDRPVEFITTRQWFIKLLDKKEALIAQGEKINWHPAHMRSRYSNWVDGLAHDWCISRQRYFGVPFPVWYPVLDNGGIDYDNPIFATADQLPVDPLSDTPKGYQESQRDKPGGFSGDPDVMDTWATSSMTPQLMSHWGLDGNRHKKLFPMDIRPQSHEIIRTWAFYTILKAYLHEKEIPWKNVIISGWILDPDRKKMSKSKGNTITPLHLIDQYSADGVRYWASRARLGVDTAFDEKVFKIGQKLTNKLFNVAKFVLGQIDAAGNPKLSNADIKEPLDKALALFLLQTSKKATEAFDKFDYSQALQESESSFWFFCDSYVELVKGRSYDLNLGNAQLSALSTLRLALSVFIRLFAPFIPYMTEELWSWEFAEQSESVHRAKWPNSSDFEGIELNSEPTLLDVSSSLLSAIHSAKTSQQKSLGAPLSSLELAVQSESLEIAKLSSGDLARAAKLQEGVIAFVSAEQIGAKITFKEQP